VAVLELAEALAKGRRPKRTIIFTWFGSEESGGYGAGYFLEHPPVPLDRIVANLEFEMIGRPDAAVPPHTLWLTGYQRSDLGPRLAQRGAASCRTRTPPRTLHALGQHPAGPPRRRRADGVELRLRKDYANRRTKCASSIFPHDRRDPLDVRAGAMAGELDYAGVASRKRPDDKASSQSAK
jgi:hypothetical protein